MDPVRPEPVVDNAKMASATVGLVTALGTVLVLLGVTTQDDVNNWASVSGVVVTAGATFLAAWLPIFKAKQARELVTPLSSPETSDGVSLIPTR